MEFQEIKEKSQAELQRLLSAARDKLRELRFKDANKQLKNVRELRLQRQLVARILTALNRNK